MVAQGGNLVRAGWWEAGRALLKDRPLGLFAGLVMGVYLACTLPILPSSRLAWFCDDASYAILATRPPPSVPTVVLGLLAIVHQQQLRSEAVRLSHNLDRATEDLLRAKKLEAVGRLAGGFAHD